MHVEPAQMQRLQRAHSELTKVLKELGVIDEPAKPPVEPQWLRDTAKQWGLLNALANEHDGDLGRDDWSRLGRQHGYDPRGLGGFFVGTQPLMSSQGVRRVLTPAGRRFLERWRKDFEAVK